MFTVEGTPAGPWDPLNGTGDNFFWGGGNHMRVIIGAKKRDLKLVVSVLLNITIYIIDLKLKKD